MIKNSKKISLIMILIIVALTILGGCNKLEDSGKIVDSPNINDDKVYNLKLATVQSDPHPFYDMGEFYTEEIEKRTDGKVKIKVYYGGQLGNEEAMVEELRNGTVDITIGGAVGISSYIPELDIFSFSYLYDSLENYQKAFESGSPLDTKYKEIVKDRELGWQLASLFVGGTRNYFSAEKPIYTPDDLKGIKMRTPGGEVFAKTWAALGAIPTSLTWNEIYSGIQTGVVESFEATISGFYAAKFYEVAPIQSLTEHTWLTSYIGISDKVYDELPQKYIDILLEISEEASVIGAKGYIDDEDRMIEEMVEQYGMVVNEVDKDKFIEASMSVHDELAQSIPNGPELLQMIRDSQK